MKITVNVDLPESYKGVMEKTKPMTLAPRIVLNTVEGWGKTTLGAFMPEPYILMHPRETGYMTLLSTKPPQVPECYSRVVNNWVELTQVLEQECKQEKLVYKTLVLDGIDGFERMCHDYTCTNDFEGDYGKKGFLNYMQGYQVAIGYWTRMLDLLSILNNRGVAIVLLGHTVISHFENPLGKDFDRINSNLHKKTWSVTHAWVDAALFGDYVVLVDDDTKSAIGGTERIIYTQHRDTFDAKNRYQMPAELRIPNDRQKMAEIILGYIWKDMVNGRLK